MSSAVATLPVARSPIKFAGGKAKLVPAILERFPRGGSGTYFEPFLGGGALFFALAAEEGAPHWHMADAILGDANPHLVRMYNGVRDDVRVVIEALQKMPNTEEWYYRLRSEWDPTILPIAQAAAWFIYLNKKGFNGLWRVNKAGVFNVPYGDNPRAKICDEENLRAVSRTLARFPPVAHADFAVTVELAAAKGDVCYLDCPYYPVSKTSDFTSYTRDGFTGEDQIRLRDLAVRLKERGVHVILSNADVPRVRELYSERYFRVDRVEAARSINSIGGRRGKVGEVIIT